MLIARMSCRRAENRLGGFRNFVGDFNDFVGLMLHC